MPSVWEEAKMTGLKEEHGRSRPNAVLFSQWTAVSCRVYKVQRGVHIKQHKPELRQHMDWWPRARAQPPITHTSVNYGVFTQWEGKARQGSTESGWAAPLTPYFFSSALAHNLHPHQNLGQVVLKTHWLHVCLYASYDKVTNGHHRQSLNVIVTSS